MVVLSDETKINHLGSDGRKWVWKKAGEGLNDRTVNCEIWRWIIDDVGLHDVGGGRIWVQN